jgi:hypothetical protein
MPRASRGILGEGALPALLAEVKAHEREMTAVARRLFAGWLEHVVGVPSDRDLIHS